MNKDLYMAINADPYRDCYIDDAEVTISMMYNATSKLQSEHHCKEKASLETRLEYYNQRGKIAHSGVCKNLKNAGYMIERDYLQLYRTIIVFREEDLNKITSIVSKFKSYNVQLYQDWQRKRGD